MAISILMIIGSITIFPYISWYKVFNAPKELNKELSRLMQVVFILFAMRFTLQLINPILAAHQKTALTQFNNFLSSTFALLSIFLMTKLIKGSLFALGFAYSIYPVIVYLAVSLYWFLGKFKYISPNFHLFKKKHLKSVFNLGIIFLINQIAVIVLSTTSNIIISHISGPEKVTPYAITHRYFFLISTIFSMLTTPLWPAFTDAYTKRDYNWINRIVKKFNNLWLLSCLLVFIMLIMSPIFFRLWIGDKVEIPFLLSFLMAFYVIIMTYVSVYSSFLCGVSKIGLATLTSLISSVLYIPLALLFSKTLCLGFYGVVVASIAVVTPNIYTHPTQFKKLIANKATGIWNI